MTPEDRKTIARHIGTALRHARAAQEANITGGPAARIVGELQCARVALDDAERLAERGKEAS